MRRIRGSWAIKVAAYPRSSLPSGWEFGETPHTAAGMLAVVAPIPSVQHSSLDTHVIFGAPTNGRVVQRWRGGHGRGWICVFSDKTPRPVAAFAEVPDEIRRLWSRRAGIGEYHDIFLVEAIGPLLVLCCYPHHLRGAAWVHYIDNTAAQHALLRGSSSIYSGVHIVGLTWDHAADLD